MYGSDVCVEFESVLYHLPKQKIFTFIRCLVIFLTLLFVFNIKPFMVFGVCHCKHRVKWIFQGQDYLKTCVKMWRNKYDQYMPCSGVMVIYLNCISTVLWTFEPNNPICHELMWYCPSVVFCCIVDPLHHSRAFCPVKNLLESPHLRADK